MFLCTAKSRFVIMCAFTVHFEPLILLEREEFPGYIRLKLCKLAYVQIWDETLGHSSPHPGDANHRESAAHLNSHHMVQSSHF